jgi:hypothetical protein
LPDVLSGFSALHATIQLYEAGEGVPADLKAMTTTGRRPQKGFLFCLPKPLARHLKAMATTGR